MPNEIYAQIKAAFRHLDPEQVRSLAGQPLSVGLVAASHEGASAMEHALLPAEASRERRRELEREVRRAGAGGGDEFDLLLYEEELLTPPGGFRFEPAAPRRSAAAILDARPELALPLARRFTPFRRPVIERVVGGIAKENATFALFAAMPEVLPSLIQLPWAVGEFASDTAFITMNEVRMAFLIAAASDHEAGYGEQRGQIAGIVAAAFGWRALARRLAERIPFAGGVLPKAAVAYAGTFVVGATLERFYRLGYGLTRAERREVYDRALGGGWRIVAGLLG